ncbi:flagellar biosynthesis protein FlhF [Cohnella terricola]|uniref:Flagellar biosynthesis protein FlhF n=1 Tax=Cohnella terricola TaxID=1289167 RepID=A0A559JCP1_9BACL|nr:flagellar biosynthesis protein FlhF [Cohnella terricola]TVX97648.1 flagellar biosynthesis protein FlhF [Cohnella terricola]
MKVKRYIVDELPEAVQKIRSELGSDAVILNTKEIRVGGFLGMFRKKRMEVIAAIDEASMRQPARPSLPLRTPERKAPAPPPEEPSAPAVLPSSAIRDRYTQTPFADSGRTAATSVPRSPLLDIPVPEQSLLLTEKETAVSATRPNESDNLSERAEWPPVNASAAPVAESFQTMDSRPFKVEGEEHSHLLQELRSLKEMMAKMSKQQTYRSMPDSVLKWSKRLAEQGVEPAYVEQFAEEMNTILGDRADSPEEAYATACGILHSWLSNAAGGGIAPSTRIVHFVGPTGVGKTTTIAKLAADQSYSESRKVGFITADTYRIAAVDQLRTYADILNIPLEVVFSPAELSRAYKKLEECDLLFMDTAGRNYRNELFVSEVKSLLSPWEQSETVLVLSMTSKFGDMKMVASQFAKYGVKQLLLTKFDETDSFGAVLNLIKQFDFRISYITCGQTVPDDIRPFEPEDLVRRILGDGTDD